MSLFLTSWTQITYQYTSTYWIMSALGTFQPQLTPTDWERFRSLASDVIPFRFKSDSVAEAEKAASAFTTSVATAYKFSTCKLTLSDVNNELPGLDHLQLKRRLRKFSMKPGIQRVKWNMTGSPRRSAELQQWNYHCENIQLINRK